MSRRLMSAAVLALSVVAASPIARADLSKSVISTFRGQLVISKDELPEGKNDRDTVSKIKAASLKELVGEPHGDVTAWHFHYTAFLKATGASTLKLEFMNGKQLAADKNQKVIDAAQSVLAMERALRPAGQ